MIFKHLKVLERAGLISRRRDAQFRPCRLKASQLKEATEWMEHYRSVWEESFERFDRFLDDMKKNEKNHARKKIAPRLTHPPAKWPAVLLHERSAA